jgi:opacity protein-like surface antigen
MIGLRRVYLLPVAILLSCPVLLPAAPAQAQNSEITFYVGGLLGDSVVVAPLPLIPQVESVYDDNVTGGFRYAYFFHPRFAAEFGFGFTPSSISTSTCCSSSTVLDVNTYIFQANLLAHLYNGPLIPYVTAGVAGVNFNFEDRQNTGSTVGVPPSETDFSWDAGGGVKIPFRKNMAFRFDGRSYWMRADFTDNKTRRFTEITGGLSILFDL